MLYNLADFGFSGSTKNFGQKLLDFLTSLPQEEEKIISFPKDTYHFSEDDCISTSYFMTNTVSEREIAPPAQLVGIMLKNLKNVTLQGNGSLLLYAGRMTEFVIDNCQNTKIMDFVIDFAPSSVVEYKVIKKTCFSFDMLPNQESTYDIVGKNFRFSALNVPCKTVLQERDDEKEITYRKSSLCWIPRRFFERLRCKPLEGGALRVYFFHNPFKVGYTYQQLSARRDGCGCFVTESADTTFLNLTFHYIHGMGILCQMSHNISILKCQMRPNYEKRTTTTFADMVHASMCSGTVSVVDSYFESSRDDIINVHGNHFKVVGINGNVCNLKFMHPQTYGFMGFKTGHEVEFIDTATMLPIASNIVKSAKMLDLRTIEVCFENDIAQNVSIGSAVENVTMTSALYVDNITGKHIPTRGILVSTRRPVIIKNSTFYKTYMSAILISDDAHSWWESGYARDVQITGNKFIQCQEYVINVLPENRVHNGAVHKNIRVCDNLFVMDHKKVAKVKSTDGFVFSNNKITGIKNFDIDNENSINVVIENNIVE